jgi:hypothetical protein
MGDSNVVSKFGVAEVGRLREDIFGGTTSTRFLAQQGEMLSNGLRVRFGCQFDHSNAVCY